MSFEPVECEYATNEQCKCKHCTSLSSEDISWRLIKTYFEDKGYVKSQIINYNELIYKFIPEVITRLGSFTVVNGNNTFVWTVKTPTFGLPYVKEYEGEYRFVTPAECRLRSLNYESPLYANMEIEYKTALSTHKNTIEKVLIGHIPVMLKSALCSLNNKTETQMAELGECMYDHGGYFIINGGEKVLIAQERMAHNQVFCYQEKTGEFTAELRSVPEGVSKAATQVTVKYHYQSKNSLKNLQNHRFSVKLHYTKKEIPIMIVFKALGVLEETDILKMIHPELSSFASGDGAENEKLAKIYQMLQPSFEEASIVTTQEIALRFVGMNTNIPIQGAEKQIEYAKNVVLIKEMFPHLGVEEKFCPNKAFLLGHMVYKCLLTVLGERDVDDRDHFGNKRIDLAGNLIGNIFRISFTRVMKDFKKLIEKKLAQGKVINLKNEFDSESITKSIRNSIATGNWGSGNSKSNRTGVTQPLHRLTYISTLCHIRRLVAPIAKEGKNPKPRQLHNSLYARTCAHETPEGSSVGLIKNWSMLAEVSVDSPSAPIHELIGYQNLDPITEFKKGTKVFINGVCIGTTGDPESLYAQIKVWKLQGMIQFDTSIVFNTFENEINVMTDGGRSIRPLLFIHERSPEEFLVSLREAMKSGQRWTGLCKHQLLEYIDGKEEEHILVSMDYDEWKQNKFGYQFTHLEIHPAMILGVAASTIPLPHHNQAPRVCYQASQLKQALGIYAMNFANRFDTQSHVMWYPQKPLISGKMAKMLKVEDMPAGQQAIVAIMCHTGFNQEDSIIVNRAAIERGMFRSFYFRSYSDNEVKYGSNYDEFSIPEEANKGSVGEKRYDLLDNDGIVGVGLRVGVNDVMIGKTTPITAVQDGSVDTGAMVSGTGINGGGSKTKLLRKDTSIAVKNHEEGMIDNVLFTSNEYDRRMVKIRIRKTRIPEIGDKLSSRSAQKGTIGMILNQEDLPFTQEGITPDLIINTHCIPSRMTISQLLEVVMAKTKALTGMDYDASPFRKDLKMEDVCEDLHSTGYQKHGWERMYCGATGKPLNAMIFIGPTYYQRLKHMVADKYHCRSTGITQTLTRQPTEGRSKDGGLRFGEMERDALIAHGASAFLKEKLFTLSDKYEVPVCNKCGMIGHPNKTNCRACKDSVLFKVDLPYACKLLFQELLAMNIAPRIKMNEKGQPEIIA